MGKNDKSLPRQLGRYEIVHKIASGGMASVYLGRMTRPKGFSRLVAVKVCHPHLSEDPKFRDMLLQEARLAAQIRHPNVVGTLDVGVEDELYLVMDYVDGASVSELAKAAAKQQRSIPIAIAAAILIDALRGLHAAHTATDATAKPLGVIHRDVSPQNLLVGRDGVTRVADFGVAKAVESPVTTKSGEVKGKLAYMAPEQLQGNAALTTSADVFSLGVVAWELVEGQPLFHGNTHADTLQRVLYIPIPPFESESARAHPRFVAAIEQALQREPENRTSSAQSLSQQITASGVPIATTEEVADFVQDLLGGGPTTLDRMQLAVADSLRANRIKVAWVAGGLACALLLVVIAVAAFRPSPDNAESDAGQGFASPVAAEPSVASPTSPFTPGVRGQAAAAVEPKGTALESEAEELARDSQPSDSEKATTHEPRATDSEAKRPPKYKKKRPRKRRRPAKKRDAIYDPETI